MCLSNPAVWRDMTFPSSFHHNCVWLLLLQMEQENQQLKLANLNQTEQIMLLQDKLQGEFTQLCRQEKWRCARHQHKQSNAVSQLAYENELWQSITERSFAWCPSNSYIYIELNIDS